MMNEKQQYSLVFSVESVDSDSLFPFMAQSFAIAPSYIRRKDDVLNNALQLRCDSNMWVLKETFSAEKEINESISAFFEKYKPIFSDFNRIKSQWTVRLQISVVTLWAQFKFDISEKTLAELANLGLPLELSFFSYGEVENK